MKSPLPAAFVAYLASYCRSAQFTTPRRLHRGLILRWTLWQDGHESNALPGYATCPPAGRGDFPAGWTLRNITDIAKEAIGQEVISARLTAAARPRKTLGLRLCR